MMLDWVKQFNEVNQSYDDDAIDARLYAYSQLVTKSFKRQFRTTNKPYIRKLSGSSLGKPAKLLALWKLGYADVSKTSGRLQRIFHAGDVEEAEVMVHLHLGGVPVEAEQLKVSYAGINGHIDGIIGGDTVFDIKTMSDAQIYGWARGRLNDDRGYLSQLAFYRKALDLPHAGLLIAQKSSRELIWVPVPDEVLDERLERIDALIPWYNNVQTLSDVYDDAIGLPEGVPEKCNRKFTGMMMVPEVFKYTHLRYALYDIVDGETCRGEPREYLGEPLDESTGREALERLQAEGYVTLQRPTSTTADSQPTSESEASVR